ncbi:MAG: DUF1573 domain-containing protein [Desulfobacterales bacterium]|nr:DUF1573 domain-containing protein [Desulfobacterales bacterium]
MNLKKTLTIGLILSFCFTGMARAEIAAVVDEPIYIFEAVPEGTRVTHEFTIKNTGDGILKILDVKPP